MNELAFPVLVDDNYKDLSTYSNTIPTINDNEIKREHIIKNIEETFSSTNKVIMLEGLNVTGRTTLLAQFARKHRSNCFSFFIGDDYWKSNVSYFLLELCIQMAQVSSEGLKNHLSNYDFYNLKDYELIQIFSKLYSDICKQARQKNTTFYFVIDGLEKLSTSIGQESILKYIPQGDSEGVYILLSSLKGVDYEFNYFPMQIQFFSRLETEIILNDYLTKEEIDEVYVVSDGMPGYIIEILRQLKELKPKDEVLRNLPPSFNNLLEKNWSNYDISDTDFLRLLSIITYSVETILFDEIVGILNLSENRILNYLDEVSFIELRDNKIELLSAYKNFLKEKLIDSKADTLQSLIEFYEGNLSKPNAMIYLPELYQEQKEYQSLVKLIDIKNIYNTVQRTQQISIVRKNLRILSDMAYNNNDWKNLSWSLLTESVFTQIATTPPAIEDQVKALLSLNLYKDALILAFSCVLPEDRLILLSHICNYMKKNNIEISIDIVNSIEDSINLIDTTVDLSEELINKLINICSNIFHINASLSLKLLERIVNKTGENVEKEKLMDYLLIRLLFRVEDEGDGIEQLKNQIGNDDLQNFIKATSDAIHEVDYDGVIKQIELLNDTSAKLFYLQNWCSKNIKNSESHRVVEYALNIMTESNEYTPTQRHLRQFAEPLIYSIDNEVTKSIVSKIENLQSTIIKKPVEEYARLELILSQIEKKWSEELAVERFYGVFINLDEVEDYDSKCLVLIHLIETYFLIFNNDADLLKDLRNQLIMEYNRLITSSADHFKITKKIIFQLTKIDRKLALTFASKLNTKQRIYSGYAEIIKAHIRQDELDFEFLQDTLNKIDEKPFKDWVFVQILKRLMIKDAEIPTSIKSKFYGMIQIIDSPVGKALAFAYYINLIHGETEKCNSAFKELQTTFERIDGINEKKELGFTIVQILSDSFIEYAEVMYTKVTKDFQHNIFGTRLNQLFIEVMELLIRTVPDILKSEDYKFKIKHIKNIIFSIPSSYQQCVLLSNLALRCSVNGHKELIGEISEKCLDILEKANEDYDTQTKITIEIAPLLYEYEKSILFEKLDKINSPELKDTALKNIIKFIISKRPIEDPLDIKTFLQKVDYPEALKICELISHVQIDSNIYAMISSSVDAMIEQTSSNKYRSKLKEKQLLNIAEKLIYIINEKLPDKNNIKHDGYKIACFGYLAKLRDTASHRANTRWNTLFPSRMELRESALGISNISDRVFVLASLGKSTYFTEETLGLSFIKEAEANLQYLSNPLDRAERYELVAESYQETSNKKAAKFLLEQAMNFAKACSHEHGRDQLIGGLIDLAHSIDPNLAQSYASNMDSTESLLNLSERITTLSLHSDPKKIQSYNKDQTDRILFEFFSKMLKTICSGRGTIHHNEVIGKYLSYSGGQRFETITLGISWFIENSIASNRNFSRSELSDFFIGVLQLLELIKNVEVSMYEGAASKGEDNFYKVLSESNIHTFDLNEQEEAFSLIKKWIHQNENEYLKFYDPYFNEEMLELFRDIGIDARIFIYTSARFKELEEIPNKYKNYWNRICDQVPPETHFYIFSTNSGESPLHDRFIIGSNSGLKLGTSLNGFGSKFSTITFLDFDEKEKIEREIISPIVTMPPIQYKNEKLVMRVFSLNS
jgi:hypothetical protein